VTMPTVVIFMDGGLILDICVDHQVRAIVVDYDVEGSSEEVQDFGGGRAIVSDHGLHVPGPGADLVKEAKRLAK
jgi:hypothetical protein